VNYELLKHCDKLTEIHRQTNRQTDRHLGVVPVMGLRVALYDTNPVIIEKMVHTVMNLHHRNFTDRTTGINHIPINVDICTNTNSLHNISDNIATLTHIYGC